MMDDIKRQKLKQIDARIEVINKKLFAAGEPLTKAVAAMAHLISIIQTDPIDTAAAEHHMDYIEQQVKCAKDTL